jgi:hypothetical protein
MSLRLVDMPREDLKREVRNWALPHENIRRGERAITLFFCIAATAGGALMAVAGEQLAAVVWMLGCLVGGAIERWIMREKGFK